MDDNHKSRTRSWLDRDAALAQLRRGMDENGTTSEAALEEAGFTTADLWVCDEAHCSLKGADPSRD